jgi:hypothetical protein
MNKALYNKFIVLLTSRLLQTNILYVLHMRVYVLDVRVWTCENYSYVDHTRLTTCHM